MTFPKTIAYTHTERNKFIGVKAPIITFTFSEVTYTFTPVTAYIRPELDYFIAIIYKLKLERKQSGDIEKMKIKINYRISDGQFNNFKANLLFRMYSYDTEKIILKKDIPFLDNFNNILDLVLSLCFSDRIKGGSQLYDIESFRPIILNQFKYDNVNLISNNNTDDTNIKEILTYLTLLKKDLLNKPELSIDDDVYVIIDDAKKSSTDSPEKDYQDFTINFLDDFRKSLDAKSPFNSLIQDYDDLVPDKPLVSIPSQILEDKRIKDELEIKRKKDEHEEERKKELEKRSEEKKKQIEHDKAVLVQLEKNKIESAAKRARETQKNVIKDIEKKIEYQKKLLESDDTSETIKKRSSNSLELLKKQLEEEKYKLKEL